MLLSFGHIIYTHARHSLLLVHNIISSDSRFENSIDNDYDDNDITLLELALPGAFAIIMFRYIIWYECE